MHHKRMPHSRSWLESADGSIHAGLGPLVAEEDRNLDSYYVRKELYVGRALKLGDPAVFFRGPKGVGKSAILQMVSLEKAADERRVLRISPDDLAFSALANVDTSTPLLSAIDKNQWLFKTLWDYVLAVEILRREYSDLPSLFKRIFQGKQEKQARQLLTMTLADDGSKRTLTQRILELIREIEITTGSDDCHVGTRVAVSSTPRAHHLPLLSQINQVAGHLADQLRTTYYILIDDLDLHWNDTPVQNAFIAALFMSLRKLNKTPLRFVVAIREDIYRNLPLEDKDKSRDWVCSVEWSKPDVLTMVQKRVATALGCGEADVWESVFDRGAKETLWHATRGMPRELIRLCALCIETARREGRARVDTIDVATSVEAFSSEKIEDLGSEHRHDYPGLDRLVRRMTGWPREFSASRFDDFAIQLAMDVQDKSKQAAKYSWAGGFADNPRGLVRALLQCGVLLYKANRTSRAEVFDSARHDECEGEPWLAIHPIYAAGLRVLGAA